MKPAMTSKERVMTTFAHQEPDRVPIGYSANGGIDGRLRKALGLKDGEWVGAALGVDCRRTLEIMMPGGGYCFAPTHALQDNSPTENVLAMYEAARKYGVYR